MLHPDRQWDAESLSLLDASRGHFDRDGLPVYFGVERVSLSIATQSQNNWCERTHKEFKRTRSIAK